MGDVHIPKRVWAPILVLLLLAGLLFSLVKHEVPLVQTRTSYGAAPYGWGAAYDLLVELRFEPRREREKLASRPRNRTQWLIEPVFEIGQLQSQVEQLNTFARTGGVVVVIGAEPALLRALGTKPAISVESPVGTGDDAGVTDASDAFPALLSAPLLNELTGSLLPRERRVELPSHGLFALDQADFVVRAGSSQGAFVLERKLGPGKLVLVGASDFLSNERLGNVDNAQLLVDLVRGYGAPSFDERCHGLMPDRSLWATLGTGFVLLAGLSFTLLTLAALSGARRWPLPRRTGATLPPPTLELFVASLASLYRARGARAPEAVFRAYRAGFVRRLQRRLYGQTEVSQAQLDARLARDAAQRGAEGVWVQGTAEPRSAAQLMQAVASLERYAAANQSERKR